MKFLQKILKISAKYAFKKLRENSPYFCKDLDEKGNIVEERKNFKELLYTENSVQFSMIIVKNSYRWTALSCFIPYKKKTLCLSPTGPQE